MVDKHPFEYLIEQFDKVIKLLKEHLNTPVQKIKTPADADKFLEKLNKAEASFKALGNVVISLSGVSISELENRLKGSSEEIVPSGKRLLEKVNTLKKEFDALQERYLISGKLALPQTSTPSAPPQTAKSPEKKLTDKQKAQKRRSKFKRIGSDEKWKPL